MNEKKYKVLVPDAQYYDDAGVERKLSSEYFEYDIRRVRKAEAIPDSDWAGVDALQIWHEVPISSVLIGKLTKCRGIVRCGVGYDHIDIAAAGKAGIPVCNTPDYGTSEVADHAIGMVLNLVRGIGTLNRELIEDPVTNYVTAKTPPLMRRIRNTRMGIIGLGRIGTAMALRAKAFGMIVSSYDPYQPRGIEIALGVERVDALAELLESCPVISLHTPLTEETRGMINAKTLRKMRLNSILVNTARGAIVDLDDLYDSLKGKHLGGAALDVLPNEPPDGEHPLIRDFREQKEWIRDRFLLTPHSAWNSPESRFDARTKSTETLLALLLNNELRNCVNVEYLVNQRYEKF